jgi:hypothetical protein
LPFTSSNISNGLFFINNQSKNLEDNLIHSQKGLLNSLESPYLEQLLKYSYIPIINSDGSGDDFIISDNLQVNQEVNVSLNTDNSYSDTYTISSITDYSTDSLQYNITAISASKYFDYQQTIHNKDEVLSSSTIRIAQSFDITWPTAIFTGAKIYLLIENTIGVDVLELFIVNASISDGKPDMSSILSSATNGPFNESNPITESTLGNTTYYDFNDIALSTGKYYVVANVSNYDATDGDGFNWRGQQGSVYADSYMHDGTVWSSIVNKDYILAPELTPAYANGTAMRFSDPAEVQLRDNGVDITSFHQTISGSGVHTLTTNTSVGIEMNNLYIFSRSFVGQSFYTAINSSFYDYSISWSINWFTPLVDIYQYTNPIRLQSITIPNGWNNLSQSFLINDSIPIVSSVNSNIHTLDLDVLLHGSNYYESDFVFYSTSRNYLYDSSISSETFNLGYWTTNTTHAIGYYGSDLDAVISVKEDLLSNITTGQLNFTLYSPDGEIIAMKTNLDSNISFVDTTSYSQIISSQLSPGVYSASTSFDPSVYGSDTEGFWTVAYEWTNGTAVGFFASKVTVVKPTFAEFEWEELSDSDVWINNPSTEINRINGESIRVRVNYYNISDPFFVGNGTSITAASVSYSTSWLNSGSINFNISSYDAEIATNALEGSSNVQLFANGQFLQNHTLQFSVRILHIFRINMIQSPGQVTYTDLAAVSFEIIDISNMSVQLFPEEITVILNAVNLTSEEFNLSFLDGIIEIELDTQSLGLKFGSHSIEVIVTKTNFINEMGQSSASLSFPQLEIIPIKIAIVIEQDIDEMDTNTQSELKFSVMDTDHSIKITELTDSEIELSADIEGVEVWLDSESAGIYTVIVKILEPTVASLNIYISISISGYESVDNFRLASIQINLSTTDPDSKLPFYLFIIIGILGAGAVIVPSILLIRRRKNREKRAQQDIFTRTYNFYEGVLSITKLIIVHNVTSLPVYEMDLGSEITIEPSLISGFLSAVSSVGSEIRGERSGGVRRIQYKEFQVTASQSDFFTLYTFSESELNEEIEQKLTVISDWFALMFPQINADWDGSTEPFRLNLKGITEKIMKEIHLWIFYPFRVSPYKNKEIEEMSGIRKRMIDYIGESDTITISRLFDDFDDIKLEQGLPIIFELIETNILEPEFDAYKIATVRF